MKICGKSTNTKIQGLRTASLEGMQNEVQTWPEFCNAWEIKMKKNVGTRGREYSKFNLIRSK
jgi:hypothetical protein